MVGGVTTQSGLLYQDSASLQVSPQRTPLPDLQADTLKLLRDSLDTLESNERAQERKHPEVRTALILLTPELEKRLRAAFLNHAIHGSDSPAGPPDADSEGATLLRHIYQPVVEQVVASTAKGSPLRRRAAMQRALDLLDENIKAAVKNAIQPAETGESGAQKAPAKVLRGRKKKGES